jgi:hypothetical protein
MGRWAESAAVENRPPRSLIIIGRNEVIGKNGIRKA